MMGGGAGGMMGGGAGGPAPGGGATSSAFSGAPLEPSRANPFIPVDAPDPLVKFYTSKTTYGYDTAKLPIGYLGALPSPEMPPAPPPAMPPNPTPLADLVRVSSIVWADQDTGAGAPGRVFLTYETPEGDTRMAVPGSRIFVEHPDTEEVQSWRVVRIEPQAAVVRNTRTGEETKVYPQARSRSEKRYWGARGLGEELTDDEQQQRVVPGRSTVLPGGSATSAAGAAGGMGGMGQGGQAGGGMAPGGMMGGGPGGAPQAGGLY